jgi:GNAT superfamily N-acetyltransferase
METMPVMNTPFELAAQALARALLPDPFYAAVSADLAADAPARHELLCRYFFQALEEAEQFGAVSLLEPEPQGAAIWLYPQPAGAQQNLAREKNEFLSNLFGRGGFLRYQAIVDSMHSRALRVLPPASWYLSIVGLDPHLQGRGLGERLLQPTLAAADKAGMPCYLETFNSRNRRFYQRLGFTEAAAHFEPLVESQYWIMLRTPTEN